jgi:predicted DNA-binding WGR domain protein
MSVFSIQLEARDPARNRFRHYQLDVARDLFGAWLVEIKFGRIGAKGRKLVSALDDEHAARRMVCERLKRRAGAPKRIEVDPGNWTGSWPVRLSGTEKQHKAMQNTQICETPKFCELLST